MKQRYYILRDRKALPTNDLMKWAAMIEDAAARTVKQTWFPNTPHWMKLDLAREKQSDETAKSLGLYRERTVIDLRTHVSKIMISTVFLGLDHGWGTGPPLLFETMVFNGPLHEDMDRYTTWAQAEAGHAKFCEQVRAALVEHSVKAK